MSIPDGDYFFYVNNEGGPLYVTAQRRDDANDESQLAVSVQDAAISDAIWKVKEEGNSGVDQRTYSFRTLDDKFVLSVGPDSRLVASQNSGNLTDNEKWVILEVSPGASYGPIRRANFSGVRPQYWFINHSPYTPVLLIDRNPTSLSWRPAPPRD